MDGMATMYCRTNTGDFGAKNFPIYANVPKEILKKSAPILL